MAHAPSVAPGSPEADPDLAGPAPRAAGSAGFWALAAFVVALLAQSLTLGGRYALDDVPVVQRNPALERGVGALGASFRAPAWPGDLELQPYRPLTTATFHAERLLTGGRVVPALSHGVNLLLHGLVAALTVVLLLAWLPGRPLLALAAGLLVGVHPAATTGVALLTGRSALLGLVLGLLALRAFAAYRPGRALPLPWLALSLFLALLACEALIALPLVALVADAAQARRGPLATLRARWPAYLVGAGAVALWALLWSAHGPGGSPVEAPEPGALGRMALGLEAGARALLHVLVPVGFLADRTNEAVSGVGWPLEGARLVAVYLAGVVWLAALLLPLRRGAPALLRAVVLVAGLVLLGASLTLPLGAVREDRWAYLALPAFALLAGLAAEALAAWAQRSSTRRVLVRFVPGLALLALTFLSVRVAQGLADDPSAHARLLDLPGGHGPAMLRRAERLMRQADEQRAASARLPARHPDPLQDPGRAPLLEAAREARAAALDLLKAAVRHPATRDDPRAWMLLGLLQLESTAPSEAFDTLARARQLDPLLSGRQREALASDPRALRRAARIYFGLLRAHATQGRPQAAADAAQQAVRFEQDAARHDGSAPDMDLLFRAALVLLGDGRYAEGLPVLERVGLECEDPLLRAQAIAQLERGRQAAVERVTELLREGRRQQEHPDTMRMAVEAYEEALRIDPDSFEARYWAAQVRGMHFGSYELAIASVEEGLARLARTPPSGERDRRKAQLEELLTRLSTRRDAEEAEQR